jgi:hypothetical protein
MRFNPKESAEGRALIKRTYYHKIELDGINLNANDFIIHISNEGARHPVYGKQLVLQGLKCGVSDYFFAYPVAPYHGCWIELKRKGAPASEVKDNQRIWLDRMNRVGYYATVAFGWEHAWEILTNYLNGTVDDKQQVC